MPYASFAAQVNSFVLQTNARMLAVFRESSQRVITVMQTPVGSGGSMPVDTGFLRASLRVYNGAVFGAPALTASVKGAAAYNVTAAVAAISNAQLGETITALYLASYALRVNYGYVGKDSLGREYNQSGYLFVELAAQQWPSIVRQVSAELKSRVNNP